MKNIAILLSTYNGEKYIYEQIRSILKQSMVNITLYIRDDGSTDNTVNIIKNIDNEKIKLYIGDNIGPCKSFLELIKIVSLDYDYFAFSDQDDYWYSKKIIRAIEKINTYNEKPTLYYSALNFCDENLNFKYLSYNKINANYKFSLIRSIFPGCTMVFNKKTMQILKMKSLYKQIMHDQLVFQIVSGTGGYIYYDKKSYINYRIHGSNVSQHSGIKKKLYKIYKEMIDNSNKRLIALQELKMNYGDIFLEQNYKSLLELTTYQNINIIKKIKLLFDYEDTLKYKIKFFLSIISKKF